MFGAEGLDGAGITSVVSMVVQVGFSAIIGWYLLTKAMPKMQDDYLRSLEKQQEKFDTRDERRRGEAKDAITAILQHCDRESQRRDEAFRQEMGVVSKALEDLREVLEELRDRMPQPGYRKRRDDHQGGT